MRKAIFCKINFKIKFFWNLHEVSQRSQKNCYEFHYGWQKTNFMQFIKFFINFFWILRKIFHQFIFFTKKKNHFKSWFESGWKTIFCKINFESNFLGIHIKYLKEAKKIAINFAKDDKIRSKKIYARINSVNLLKFIKFKLTFFSNSFENFSPICHFCIKSEFDRNKKPFFGKICKINFHGIHTKFLKDTMV